MDRLGLCGFKNFGNTCWLNSSIQCLLKTEPMINYFLSKNFNNTILSKEWARLIHGTIDDDCIITPLSFFKSIIISANKNGYMFNFRRQNDVQEFLVFFIDSIHEELKHKVNINITGKIVNELDKMAFEAMKQWKDYFKNQYSTIIEIFYGQLCSHIKAIDNDIHSYNYSPICTFSLPINVENDSSSIYDCFDLFTKKQLLDGENKWKYDKDGKYYDIEKNLMVWKFPNILILHFKRFNNSGNKINNLIEFPIDQLDLRKYCVGYDKNKSIFSLFGVCNHIGSINSGHYFSYCKHKDNWYNYDDTNITKIKEDELVTKNAYCLFYKKK
jgi:ubiquitin C-terminal hydrolase|tara:strand:- start:662 stop:1645 length:984 start_codon:yes stop_codon:yes gene_type:complete